jgi:hypothetical protein
MKEITSEQIDLEASMKMKSWLNQDLDNTIQ